MQKKLIQAIAVMLSLSSVTLILTEGAAADTKPEPTGKELAFDRSKGNCLACHDMPGVSGVDLPGNIGPPLADIHSRYTRDQLRARIWDEAKINPETAMPPFGRNKILTDPELEKVVDFIFQL